MKKVLLGLCMFLFVMVSVCGCKTEPKCICYGHDKELWTCNDQEKFNEFLRECCLVEDSLYIDCLIKAHKLFCVCKCNIERPF